MVTRARRSLAEVGSAAGAAKSAEPEAAALKDALTLGVTETVAVILGEPLGLTVVETE